MKKILLFFFLFISYSSIGGNPVCGLTQGLTEISNPETRKWADASGANIGAFEATLALTKDQRNKYSISQLEEIKAYIASSKKSKLVVQGELANAYSKFGEYVAKASNGETAVLAMIKGIPDTNKSGIYTSIGNLGDDASRFLDDIASTVGVEGKLGGELGKLDEGLVGAWEVLKKTYVDEVIRQNFDNNKITYDFIKKYPNQSENLKKGLEDPFIYDKQALLNSIYEFEKITINSSDDLIKVLMNVTDAHTVDNLADKGVKSFFRGTTRSKNDGSLFLGNPNSQDFGISTSTDPIRATIFAIESATEYNTKGVLQISLSENLKNIALSAPNRRVHIELEAIMKISAQNFFDMSKVELSIENARKLVKEVFSIDLPASFHSKDSSRELLESISPSDLKKSLEFYRKAIEYNIK